jgi:RNA polymerase sigma-70 factor (ECF subfamily)
MTDAEFQALFHEHKNAVYRFAWRLTSSPDAAEDISQEVFTALLRRPDAFDSRRGQLRSFLLGAVRNLALKRWHNENRLQELDEDQFLVEPVDVTRGEIDKSVADAVQALPPLQREVLILAEYEDLSLEEISQIVQSGVGTVKARLHRARENLRRMLAPLRPRSTDTQKVRTNRHGTLG